MRDTGSFVGLKRKYAQARSIGCLAVNHMEGCPGERNNSAVTLTSMRSLTVSATPSPAVRRVHYSPLAHLSKTPASLRMAWARSFVGSVNAAFLASSSSTATLSSSSSRCPLSAAAASRVTAADRRASARKGATTRKKRGTARTGARKAAATRRKARKAARKAAGLDGTFWNCRWLWL